MHLFTLIERHSWLAIAPLDTIVPSPLPMVLPHSNKPNKQGSVACRELLQQLQASLGMMGELVETDFPYYIQLDNNSLFGTKNWAEGINQRQARWYVSFSHSQRHVAVLLSKSSQIGVDIEDKPISEAVAKRFFSPQETAWLTQLQQTAELTAPQLQALRQLFWVLKESSIKFQHNTHQHQPSLTQGLKHDLLEYLTMADLLYLSDKPINPDIIPIIQDDGLFYGYIPSFQCGFMLQNDDYRQKPMN
ncbi:MULTISPECIES: 4'-phosphopantetheinyl transferase family protein [unclassified Moraxella]|uniref:4'-phosphopantetheinyl transferase family protein n=1 Tax=unclassified Moraxella TaxID=2685852 RepID=UPI003AF5EC12